MPTGSRPALGFTYLGMLFFVAITAAALAALGQSWQTAAQREKERELEFRGQEIARAIASYVKVSPEGSPRHPRRLEDLLEDKRGYKVVHHLRRLYPDPLTGQVDWVLIPEPGQPDAFNGVHSRSELPLLRQVLPDGTSIDNASEWTFLSQAYESRDAAALPSQADEPVPALPALPMPAPPGSVPTEQAH